jgi:hypothetical protein
MMMTRLTDNEFERLWEQVFVAYLRYHHSIYLEVLRKAMKTQSRQSVSDLRFEPAVS